MSCNFKVEIPEDKNANELIEKGKDAFNQMGGELTGDGEKGNFSIDSPVGKISGEYSISGKNMEVTISEKPMMLPCSLIEGEFRKYLST